MTHALAGEGKHVNDMVLAVTQLGHWNADPLGNIYALNSMSHTTHKKISFGQQLVFYQDNFNLHF